MPDSPKSPLRKRKVSGWRQMGNRPATPTPPCAACTEQPKGEAGHSALAFYVNGPYPGQQIFKCAHCDLRWIRHYGNATEKFAWTLFQDARRARTAGDAPPPVKAAV